MGRNEEDTKRRQEYQREYHHKNKAKPEYQQARKKQKEKLRAKCRAAVWEYLINHPCLDCGEADPVVLQFDHLHDKILDVGTMLATSYSLTMLLEEISKCEVVCANCHFRRTATRANHWKVGYIPPKEDACLRN